MAEVKSEHDTDSTNESEPRAISLLDMIHQMANPTAIEQTPQVQTLRQELELTMECLAVAHYVACRENSEESIPVALAIDLFVDGYTESDPWVDRKAQAVQQNPLATQQPATRLFLAVVLNSYSRLSNGLQTMTGLTVHSWQDCIRHLLDNGIQHMLKYHSATTRHIQSMIGAVVQTLDNAPEDQPVQAIPNPEQQVPESTELVFPELDLSSQHRRVFVHFIYASIVILRARGFEHIARVLSDTVHFPMVASMAESQSESNTIECYRTGREMPGVIDPRVAENIDWWKNAMSDNDRYAAWKLVVGSNLAEAVNILPLIHHPRADYTVVELRNLLSELSMAPGHELHGADVGMGSIIASIE